MLTPWHDVYSRLWTAFPDADDDICVCECQPAATRFLGICFVATWRAVAICYAEADQPSEINLLLVELGKSMLV